MSASSTVHGGHHDTKYVTFEFLLHAAFVADEFWGDKLEPARRLFFFLFSMSVLSEGLRAASNEES